MAQSIAVKAEMVGDQALTRGVVLVDAPVLAVRVKDNMAVAWRQTPKLRNADLDDEAATRL
jgi:hypothetical protein